MAKPNSVTPLFPIDAFVVSIAQSQLLKNLLNRSIFEDRSYENRNHRQGNVGTALSKGLSKAGHEVKFGHRDPKEPVAEAAKWGDLIILAVPDENANDAIKAIQPHADGKIVIDVTNAIGEDYGLGISCTSTAEETQKKLPQAKVVKAFNTVFAPNQSTGKVAGEQLTAFIAGNDLEAKQTVAQLTRDIGFDPVDCGLLKSARYLDAMGILIIHLAYTYGMGNKMGYKLVKA